MAEGLGLRIGRDIGVHQPQLPLLDRGIALGDVRAALPHRLDLGSLQNDANFEVFLDGIIIARAPVFGDHLVIRV